MLSSSHRFCIKQKEVIINNHLFLFNTYLFIGIQSLLNRLSSGGAKRSRTVDLLRARQALYQLSYGPIVKWWV